MPFAGELETLVHQQIERWTVPGVAVGILHEGEREYLGYGITNIATGESVVPETLFQIGSVSKVLPPPWRSTWPTKGSSISTFRCCSMCPSWGLPIRTRARC